MGDDFWYTLSQCLLGSSVAAPSIGSWPSAAFDVELNGICCALILPARPSRAMASQFAAARLCPWREEDRGWTTRQCWRFGSRTVAYDTHLYYNLPAMPNEQTSENSRIERTQPGPLRPSEDEPVSLSEAFGGRSVVREIVETVLLTLIIFLVLNTLTGRFQVRGSSMEPTLQDGQYLVVSKLTYWLHPPERGDVIVFHPPSSVSDDYIKRIIGLPGEKIEIRSGEVQVDGVLLDEPYVAKHSSYSDSWSLGQNEYFVLGDNRGNSSDSHTWGTLPRENIIGKAWISYWPPEEWGVVRHHTFQSPSAAQGKSRLFELPLAFRATSSPSTP